MFGQVQELLWMSEWKLKWSTLFLVFFSYVNSCLTSGYYDQLKEIWSILFVNVIITEARVGSGGMNFVVINPIFWIFSVLWYCHYSNVLWGYFHHWLNVMYVYVITHHNTCQIIETLEISLWFCICLLSCYKFKENDYMRLNS